MDTMSYIMSSSIRRFNVFLFVLFLIPGILLARPQAEDIPIPNDPSVLHGVLPNGLSYYVKANKKPEGIAELRLVVSAGSNNEDEDQRGLAHFLEHMLFNGTEKYPDNKLVSVLESFGIEFGPDINAYTSFEETVYQLSAKSNDEEEFSTALDVLKEWAFHATLDEEQFEKERPVLYEEWRIRRSANARMLDKIYPVLFKNSRHAERLPIGDMDIVLNAPVSALRRFYEDWYRPDLMAIIVVGDLDPQKTVEMIQEQFGQQENPKNPRPVIEYPIERHDETRIVIAHDPEATEADVSLYVKSDPSEMLFRSQYQDELARQLFFSILNERLDSLSRKQDRPFIQAESFSMPYTKDTSLAGLYSLVQLEEVFKGLEAILVEAERIQRYGVLPSELERAQANLMSSMESYWKQRNDLNSAQLASEYVAAYLMGDKYPSVEWLWDATQEYLPKIALEEVGTLAQNLLSRTGRVFIITGPSVPEITNISQDGVHQILEKVEREKIEPWKEEFVAGSLVEEVPVPGKIIGRSIVPGADITVLNLSNGARIIYKKTDFNNDEVIFSAFSKGGNSLVEDDLFISARVTSQAIQQSGIGRFSLSDLSKILAGKNVSVAPFVGRSEEGMNGSSSSRDLPELFQLIHLYHNAPRRDEEAWNAMISALSESLKHRAASPQQVYQDELFVRVYNNHFRAQPLSEQLLSEAELDEVLKIYTERFEDAGDFTYVFVGNFSPKELESLAVQWIASLPSQNSQETWQDHSVRFPSELVEFSVSTGIEPLSLVTQAWFGEWDGSYTESYRLQSLASALEMQLIKEIREEDGGTYSVGVYPLIKRIPAQEYFLMVNYSCDPERVEELTSHVLEIVERWRTSPPDKKFATDIVENQRRKRKENLKENSWWVKEILFALRTGISPTILLNRESLYETLSPEVLRQTAATYLNDERYLEGVLFPASSKIE